MISVLLPKDDKATEAIALWWENARGKGAVISASPDRAEFTQAMRASRTVFYFGHGSEEGDAWTSADGKIRFADAENIEAAKGALVVAIACFSGARLARSAVDLGVRTYVGFTKRLFIIENSDEFASVGSNAVSVLFEYGGTAARFARTLARNFLELRDHYRGPGRGLPNSTLYWVAANHNANCIALNGDPNATL